MICCVQLLSCAQLFTTPWTVARQASLSFTVSQSLPTLMSTESMMPSDHLILWAIQIHKTWGAGKDTYPQAMSQVCNKQATEDRASPKRPSQGVNTPIFVSVLPGPWFQS